MTTIYPVTSARSCRSAGRPREFDPDAALAAALDLFWRDGYEQTSLEMLISEMRISRSSFYACFGSKRATLRHALVRYGDASLAALQAAVAAQTGPRLQLRAAVETLGDVDGGRRGCFLANCVSEFGAHDPEIEQIVQAQMSAIESVMRAPLAALGLADPVERARLLMAIVMGVIAMRKAGVPPGDLRRLLDRGLDTVL